jgi:hypothetical protein
VAWHDGDTWRVALDTSDLYSNYSAAARAPDTASTAAAAAAAGGDGGTGAVAAAQQDQPQTSGASADVAQHRGLLADFTPLADFALERQYATFSEQDGCAYGIKVTMKEGNKYQLLCYVGRYMHAPEIWAGGAAACATARAVAAAVAAAAAAAAAAMTDVCLTSIRPTHPTAAVRRAHVCGEGVVKGLSYSRWHKNTGGIGEPKSSALPAAGTTPEL